MSVHDKFIEMDPVGHNKLLIRILMDIDDIFHYIISLQKRSLQVVTRCMINTSYFIKLFPLLLFSISFQNDDKSSIELSNIVI